MQLVSRNSPPDTIDLDFPWLHVAYGTYAYNVLEGRSMRHCAALYVQPSHGLHHARDKCNVGSSIDIPWIHLQQQHTFLEASQCSSDTCIILSLGL
ncbi:hypothetical protein EYR41_007384 [Orbilia oligospora]|uniref:Uncharacterized protein n=1 Tax=Orbilia oligospora TaxID=2813651 RepID=A0A7C8K2L3_ORBOL|nr:hypothetical protein TWF751_011137 [Orbilia oligospora]TGJ68327.1 hypothetical protein EYR41_007384 [Orbilia oligospora]